MPKRKRQNQPCRCDHEKGSTGSAGAARKFGFIEQWKKLNNSAVADFCKQVKTEDEASERAFGPLYIIIRDGVKRLLKLALVFSLFTLVTHLVLLASPSVQEILTLLINLLKDFYAGKTIYPFLKNLLFQSK
ncbi:hypothetical protein [uncultured Pontibacter sp.]|uniref:hypothetical protein n=1 Tax=uncultured Pontibacter sp. TaxID=453356 RepID=UPI00260F0B10|nr:hypothetical protein [uncultured Pontibacter sp.]